MSQLFGASPIDFTARWANPNLLVNLGIYTICKFAFTVVAVGCPIACGVYTPVFLIGAAAGRAFGEALNMMLDAELQITAGAYAVVGAAAMAAGVTRTISCAVMVFELTGQLNHMLPVLVAVLAAYGEWRRNQTLPSAAAAALGRGVIRDWRWRIAIALCRVCRRKLLRAALYAHPTPARYGQHLQPVHLRHDARPQ